MNDCFENHPKREDELKAWTCKCGHAWYEHSFLLMLFPFGKCEECLCPKYRHFKTTTFDERYYHKCNTEGEKRLT